MAGHTRVSMANHPAKPDSPSSPPPPSRVVRLACWSLAAIALIYGLLAGLHTVQNFDLGWQLASGRWLVQHQQIFSTDVFSYTAAGQPWIYPVLSGVIFYIGFLAG